MKKILIRSLIVIVGLVGLFLIASPFLTQQTKKHSPADTVEYNQNGLALKLDYCRPYKKDRIIFGELVPYGEVWRTGANEPTTFSTNRDIKVSGQTLKAGTYTLWTIPNTDSWEVIFNAKGYDWGVGFKGFKIVASREPEADVLNVKVPVQQNTTVEQFTIAFEGSAPVNMTLAWDDVKVQVPIE